MGAQRCSTDPGRPAAPVGPFVAVPVRPLRTARRGAALVYVVLVLLLMILVIGLALDTAKVLLATHQLQNAADAAALGGASLIYENRSLAREKAWEVARENTVMGDPVEIDPDWTNGITDDIVFGRYIRSEKVFYPEFGFYSDGRPIPVNAIKVVTRRVAADSSAAGPVHLAGPITLHFGPIVRVLHANVVRNAVAMISGGGGAGLIILDPDPRSPGLTIGGNLTLDVQSIGDAAGEGVIHVNSGVRIAGNDPTVVTDAMDMVQDITNKGFAPLDAPSNWKFPIDTDAELMADPLVSVPEPSYAGFTTFPDAVETTGGDVRVLEPGYYEKGFQINGGTVICKPGIYTLGATANNNYGLVATGGTFIARGCMFHILGPKAEVKLGGNANIAIAPPVIDPPAGYYDQRNYGSNPYVTGDGTLVVDPATFQWPDWQQTELTTYGQYGISIFQSRTNTKDASLAGTGNMDLEGVLYFPKNHVDLSGTQNDEFGAQMVCWSLEVSGNSYMRIRYDGRNKTTGSRAYLVH